MSPSRRAGPSSYRYGEISGASNVYENVFDWPDNKLTSHESSFIFEPTVTSAPAEDTAKELGIRSVNVPEKPFSE